MKLHRASAATLVLTAATLAVAIAIDFKSDLSLKTTAATKTTSPTTQTSSSTVQQSTEPTSLAPVAPVAACSDLLAVDMTAIGGNVTTAKETDSNGITYCSVEGEFTSTAGWQVMLPVANWTQRYMQVGCGGLCGQISLQPGARTDLSRSPTASLCWHPRTWRADPTESSVSTRRNVRLSRIRLSTRPRRRPRSSSRPTTIRRRRTRTSTVARTVAARLSWRRSAIRTTSTESLPGRPPCSSRSRTVSTTVGFRLATLTTKETALSSLTELRFFTMLLSKHATRWTASKTACYRTRDSATLTRRRFSARKTPLTTPRAVPHLS